MGEAIAIFFIFITVMAISLVLFGGWLAVITVRGVTRLLGAVLFGLTPHRQIAAGHMCGRCRQTNPPTARYCRRCGEQL
jgi:hypothetical protein